jgi:UDP-N-acetylglucosamine--N-acetylmuramyl-(pentapeptide) pyrophosphoryl-undecaprenol N-acetylglucosamine transferase
MQTKRILVIAGGTGGHVFPALAVAKQFQREGATVEWLGTKQGLEGMLIPKANIPLHTLTVTAFRREGLLKRLLAPIRLFSSLLQALKIIHQYKPDLVLGMGGFAAGPGGIAAWCLRCPLVIHEQNAVPGATNRILGRFAKKVLEGFPDSFPKNYLKFNQIIFTGNPVREEFLHYPEPAARFAKFTQNSQPITPLRILIVGGSQGARALNQLCPRAFQLISEQERPEIWHQSGDKHLSSTQADYKHHHVNARVEPFIDNMAEAYAWADLVICRSGALTVAELAAIGVASLLIPFPFGVDDHQTANGRFLEKIGAAYLIQQKELTPEKLNSIILELSRDRNKLLSMANAAKQFSKPEAVMQVVGYCKEVMNL